jgi:hypothetical protein
MPSFTPIPIPIIWAWVLTLDFFKSFHLGFHYLQWYNCIPIVLQHDVQMVFYFPLNKVAQDLYDVVAWYLLLLLP